MNGHVSTAPWRGAALWLSPRQQFRRWWQARLPLTDTWALGQRNIYILPTRAGLAFALTLVVMLVAAINYQLSLGFALTFALAGAGIVSMHLTHGNLRGLTLHLKPVASVFAGEPALLEVVIGNAEGRQRHGLALRFEQPPAGLPGEHRAPGETGARSSSIPTDGQTLDANEGAGSGEGVRARAVAGVSDTARRGAVWCDVSAGGQQTLHLALVPPARGWHAVPTLVLETVFPFGLFRAWTVWRPAARLLAWPQPEPQAPPLPASAGAGGPEEGRQRTHEGGEFDGVRPWRRGDTMRQVVWKKAARSSELVSRETAGSARREVWLEWAATAVNGTEPRLSRLAAWVLAADHSHLPFGLRLPGQELAPASGAAHRMAALDALAQWS